LPKGIVKERKSGKCAQKKEGLREIQKKGNFFFAKGAPGDGPGNIPMQWAERPVLGSVFDSGQREVVVFGGGGK